MIIRLAIKNAIIFFKFFHGVNKVLYMSFDKFLLAIESRDLSQAEKSIFFIKVSSFPKLSLNDKIYS